MKKKHKNLFKSLKKYFLSFIFATSIVSQISKLNIQAPVYKTQANTIAITNEEDKVEFSTPDRTNESDSRVRKEKDGLYSEYIKNDANTKENLIELFKYLKQNYPNEDFELHYDANADAYFFSTNRSLEVIVGNTDKAFSNLYGQESQENRPWYKKFWDKATHPIQTLRDIGHSIKENVSEFVHHPLDYVRQHPFRAALGVGAVVAAGAGVVYAAGAIGSAISTYGIGTVARVAGTFMLNKVVRPIAGGYLALNADSISSSISNALFGTSNTPVKTMIEGGLYAVSTALLVGSGIPGKIVKGVSKVKNIFNEVKKGLGFVSGDEEITPTNVLSFKQSLGKPGKVSSELSGRDVKNAYDSVTDTVSRSKKIASQSKVRKMEFDVRSEVEGKMNASKHVLKHVGEDASRPIKQKVSNIGKSIDNVGKNLDQSIEHIESGQFDKAVNDLKKAADNVKGTNKGIKGLKSEYNAAKKLIKGDKK